MLLSMSNLQHRIHRLSPLSVLLLVLATGLSSRGAEPAADPAAAIDIDVRASVDERWSGIHKGGAIEHGKIYGIASIKEVPATSKLLKPVNEARLVQELRAQLNAWGFTEITPKQKPDVVLTVLYGRGWLRNPYLKGTILNEDSDIVPVATILLPDQAMRQREAGYEAKVQAAQQEKLFIRVTAWKYPEAPQEKPSELWKTTMVVDDPDHRDLNQVTMQMLAAGADYFDRVIKDGEVRVNSATPPGRVIVGPTKILETVPKDK